MMDNEVSSYGEIDKPKRDHRVVVFAVAFIIVFGLLGGFLLTLNQNVDTGADASSAEIDQTLAANLRPLEERLKENPQDVDAMVRMGTLYYQAGSLRDAIRLFGNARMTEPENVDALLGSALSLQAVGRQAEADETLDSLRAVEASETDAEIKARAAAAIAEIEKQPAP